MAIVKLARFITSIVVTVTFTISSSIVNFKPVLASGPDWCTIAPDEAPIFSTGATRYVNFYEACRNHDICVFTKNADPRHRDNCDNRFKDELGEICKREFKTIISVGFREECLQVTRKTYYAGVRSSRGEDGFKKAQAEAGRVADALRSQFPSVDISRYYGDIAQELAVYQATHGSMLNSPERVIEPSIKHTVNIVAAKLLANNPASKPGYFPSNNATNYTPGNGTYCAFTNPGHYLTFRAANPAASPNLSGFISNLTYTGACPFAAGYFSYNDGVNYTPGNGTYCAFTNPSHYETFRAANPAPSLDHSAFISHLTYTDACPI